MQQIEICRNCRARPGIERIGIVSIDPPKAYVFYSCDECQRIVDEGIDQLKKERANA